MSREQDGIEFRGWTGFGWQRAQAERILDARYRVGVQYWDCVGEKIKREEQRCSVERREVVVVI